MGFDSNCGEQLCPIYSGSDWNFSHIGIDIQHFAKNLHHKRL